MSLAERAGALAYGLGWSVSSRLPEPVVRTALRVVADQVDRRDGRGVRRLATNLAVAAEEQDPLVLERLTRDAVRSYLRYWGEVFRLPRWDADEVRARVVTVDDHRLRDAYAAGSGVVAALPHQGNWDLAGAWSCAEGMPLTTVAERLRPESLFDRFVAFREGLGMEVLPMTGGDAPMPTLLARLRAGGFVCLLADRDLSRHGLEVELLGRRASLPSGPAVLAQQTGAVLLPITSAYDGERMRLTFHEPVEHRPGRDGVRAMTQDVADAFTRAIRRDPVDWHMLQRVFR